MSEDPSVSEWRECMSADEADVSRLEKELKGEWSSIDHSGNPVKFGNSQELHPPVKTWAEAYMRWEVCDPDFEMQESDAGRFIVHRPSKTMYYEPKSRMIGKPEADVVNMPDHYTKLPVECIDVTEHFNFTLGNAIKYIWRADHKGKPLEDLRKARWYIDREIARRERDGR